MGPMTSSRRAAFALPMLLCLAALGACRSLPWDITAKELGLPEPRFAVIMEGNLTVPMRDGVLLAANLYRPEAAGAYPAILVRTPYDKRNPIYGYPFIGGVFASQGYVVVIQDVRGKFGSQGEFYPLVNEGADGADTVQWIARQTWCDGRVGMFGVSYFASTEWLAAPRAGPALRTIVPVFSSQSGYDPWFDRGVLNLSLTVAWHYQNDTKTWRPMSRARWRRGIWAVPLADADEAMGASNPIYEDWLSHPVPGAFWDPMSVDEETAQITAPVLFIAGWYDPFLPRMLEDYRRVRESAGGDAARASRIIIGPWTHTVESQFDDLKTGPEARFLWQLPTILRWYDRWLKDEDNGFDAQGPIRLFVMGKDQWRSEQEWPLARTRYTSYYLHSAGAANSAAGDGALGLSAPQRETPDTFLYDPRNPVPTIGLDAHHIISPGPKEQYKVERRKDVLVFSSDALAEETEITGPIRLVLYAKSSAPDTDFTATLVDLRPDGTPVDLCSGIVRARYRESLGSPSFLAPGTVFRYEIDLGATSVVLDPGHRIRLYVSSSDFPRHDRNLNTGEPFGFGRRIEAAMQTVFHDAAHPSHLLLPVIPPGDSAGESP
jgi:putative CocE/NonD family hydrolase